MIRLGLDSNTDSTVFTTGHRLVTQGGFINALGEGIKRNLCPKVKRETTTSSSRNDGDICWSIAMMSNKAAFQMDNVGKGHMSLVKLLGLHVAFTKIRFIIINTVYNFRDGHNDLKSISG